jgi:hypothetical protein
MPPEPEPEPQPETETETAQVSFRSATGCFAAGSSCAELLTVLVTTSPCRAGAAVHRSLFLALFRSFGRLPELAGCRVIVVCDGYKLLNPDNSRAKVQLKNGIVSPEIAKGYTDFLGWLEGEVAVGAEWLSSYRVELLVRAQPHTGCRWHPFIPPATSGNAAGACACAGQAVCVGGR